MRPIRTTTLERDPAVLAEQVAARYHPLRGEASLNRLLEMIGDAQYVLIGEASHGTSEFYTWRARLSRRLIREKDFKFIAVEGDWPDCYEVNRYVKGYPEAGGSARDVVHAFERWPTWMWANWEVTALAEWLRRYNDNRESKVGFYGLDVYSLWESMAALIDYLEAEYPDLVETAKNAYHCFEPFGADAQSYGWSTAFAPEDCEDEVVDLLVELRQRMPAYREDGEADFSAEQNALVVVNAEHYYRTMVRGGGASWNVRDLHMMQTLHRLVDYHDPDCKAIVWAHNTHVGDARATDMADAGMVNIGQLARERHADDGVVLVGFASHRGSVIAGQEWGAPMERMRVPEARAGSWEAILHRAGADDKLLLLSDVENEPAFFEERDHRAIGVVYRPEREAFGNYVPTILPRRYDALLYLDETTALHPLHIAPEAGREPPETYPWGL